jgi:hypothetical protein
LLLVQFLLSVTTIKIGDQNDENKNHIRTMYTRDKGWRLFGLALAIQILFIGANYLAMMS